MNNTYLTFEEIAELKAIKAQYINDSDFAELRAFLKKNGKEISIVNRMNTNNTWEIILDSFSDSVINHPAHRKYKEENLNIGFSPEKTFVVQTYLSDLNPKLDKLYDIAYSLNFDDAVRFISQKTGQIRGFDVTSFLLNIDYDLQPFSIDSVDKNLIENTIAIDKAVSKFFDSFAKDLNAEQKTIVSKNLLQTIAYFVKNSNATAIKERGDDFKNLVNYTYNQTYEA